MVSDVHKESALPGNLHEFQEVEYWDSFFKLRNGRPFEWYGDWSDLQSYLSMLVPKSNNNAAVHILVAGCGNSALSAHLYDAGWPQITNVDFSKVVIEEMLRMHVRSRPLMRWLVMDMTHLQFSDNHFDVVLDKGSLDALMGEVGESSVAAEKYLLEVKRVLRLAGKFACITLAQNHVLGLLLKTFRQGWLLNIHKVLLVSDDSKSALQPFLVYAIKCSEKDLAPVKCFFGNSPSQSIDSQMQSVVTAIQEENKLRCEGAITDMSDIYGQLHQGRRTVIKLGGHYPAVVLDAKPDAEPPVLRCGVFLVPKGRAHEWLFSSEEGQWQVIETAQAGRLILATLDAQQTDNMDYIKQELAPLVKPLLPFDCRDSDTIPYMTTNDALSQRVLLEEVESSTTGTIHVEEVVILDQETVAGSAEGAKPKHYRRLVFRRNPNLIQSEASLVPVKVHGKERERGKNGADVVRRHSGNKKKHRVKDTFKPGVDEIRVDHSYLASDYHAGMVAGLSLIVHNLEEWVKAKEPIQAMIIGLGAGLLPMFLHNHLPIDSIQVVELDGVVGDVAKRHFGFVENERVQVFQRAPQIMGDHIDLIKSAFSFVVTSQVNSQTMVFCDQLKLYIEDGIEAVSAILKEDVNASGLQSTCSLLEDKLSLLDSSNLLQPDCSSEATSHVPRKTVSKVYNTSSAVHGFDHERSKRSRKLHILIVDADSEDPSAGLSCPPAEFLEEPFLRAARAALVEDGILVINVVARASSPHITSAALLQKVFEEVYDLEVDEHVNRVLFALPQQSHKGVHNLPEFLMEEAGAFTKLATAFAPWGNGPPIKDYLKKLKRLK